MKLRIGNEGMVLCILTVMLCAVFALSVQMYDRLENETADGALAAASQAARYFLGENEAVAAFFGMTDTAESAGAPPTAAADAAAVREAATAYIQRYNRIYAALR